MSYEKLGVEYGNFVSNDVEREFPQFKGKHFSEFEKYIQENSDPKISSLMIETIFDPALFDNSNRLLCRVVVLMDRAGEILETPRCG